MQKQVRLVASIPASIRQVAEQEYVVIRRKGHTLDWYNKRTPNVANACLLREMLALLNLSDGRLKGD